MKTSRAIENAAKFHELADEEGALLGPVSLSVDIARPLQLPMLEWHDWTKPGQLKITNTAYTAVVTGHWKGGRPSLSGGPLLSHYSLAQIHFHWGPDNSRGSEHTIEDKRYPLEMHVLLYKSSYQRPKIALRERDGIVVLAYVFEAKDRKNEKLEALMEGLSKIKSAGSQAPLCPDATNMVEPFVSEYFLYWGAVKTEHCAHTLAWLLCPTPLAVSYQQMNQFRQILDYERRNIKRNYCDLQAHMGRSVYYATMDEVKEADDGVRVLFASLYPAPSISGNSSKSCCLSARIKQGKTKDTKRESPSIEELSQKIEKLSSKTKLNELEVVSKELITNGSKEGIKLYTSLLQRMDQIELERQLPSEQDFSQKSQVRHKPAVDQPDRPVLLYQKILPEAKIC